MKSLSRLICLSQGSQHLPISLSFNSWSTFNLVSNTMFRSELEERVVSLEKHVQQLRNVIAKHTGSSMPQVCLNSYAFLKLFVEPFLMASLRWGRSYRLRSLTLTDSKDVTCCSESPTLAGTTWALPHRCASIWNVQIMTEQEQFEEE